jgi:hypothetical protein
VELDVAGREPRPENFTPSTTIVVGLTETTLPEMMAVSARALPAPPPGKVRGVLPVGDPPPGLAPPGPNPRRAPPPKPLVQLPDEEGCETVTDRAVTVEPEVVPITVTQDPAESDETVRVAVLENLVEEVQLTVVCPAVEFCTSIDVPEMAATEPEVPGKAPPPRPPNPLVPLCEAGAVVEVVAVVAALEDPPQAARAAVSATARVATNSG